jgi:hypothetical protein
MIRFSFLPAYVWQCIVACDPVECERAIVHRFCIARKAFLLAAIAFELSVSCR